MLVPEWLALCLITTPPLVSLFINASVSFCLQYVYVTVLLTMTLNKTKMLNKKYFQNASKYKPCVNNLTLLLTTLHQVLQTKDVFSIVIDWWNSEPAYSGSWKKLQHQPSIMYKFRQQSIKHNFRKLSQAELFFHSSERSTRVKQKTNIMWY